MRFAILRKFAACLPTLVRGTVDSCGTSSVGWTEIRMLESASHVGLALRCDHETAGHCMRAFTRFHRHLGIDVQGPRGTSAVAIAFTVGTIAAMAKSAAAVLTGSASMLAAAVHSWVDLLTDTFLVAGYLAARRPADESHALGHGRESYVWSLFGSVVMFIAGAEAGIWRGITQLEAPDAVVDFGIAYVVIAASFALQAGSFVQAFRFVRKRAAEMDSNIFQHVFSTSDSQLRAVVVEDFVALLGLGLAALGMALHQITRDVIYDAGGSIGIGLLLGVSGLFLINKNRRFLAGVPLTPARRSAAIALINASPEVTRVTFFFAEYIGPDRVLVSAHVELSGLHSQAELARILRRLEQQIMLHKNVGRATLTLSAPEEPSIR